MRISLDAEARMWPAVDLGVLSAVFVISHVPLFKIIRNFEAFSDPVLLVKFRLMFL